MTEVQLISKDKTLQFYDADKLYFPKICVVCGTKTDNKIQKSIIGNFTYTKEKRKDYYLNLPVCEECIKHTKIKKAKEISKVLVSSLIGLIVGIILYILTFSIFIGIASFALSSLIPLIFYTSKISTKINIDKYIQLKSMSFGKNDPEDILEIKFFNENYAKYLSKVNLQENSDLKKVKGFKSKQISEELKVDETSKMTCQKCNASIPTGMSFCTQCGTKLDSKLTEKSNASNINLYPIPTESKEEILEKKPEIAPIPMEAKKEILEKIPEIEMNKNYSSDFDIADDTHDKVELICPHCKFSLPADSQFCVSCGKTINNPQKIQIDTKPEIKPLISTQESVIKVKCSNCGHLNEPNLFYCLKCGFKL